MASTTTTTTTATILLRRTLARTNLRRNALPVSLGLTTCGGLLAAVHHQRPMQLDSAPVSTAPLGQQQTRSLANGHSPKRKDLLNAETIKELSGGSLSGFLAGLLVSVFSKTLVLLVGIGMVVVQVAARNGLDLVSILKLKERANSSRILAALNQHTAFKLSFAIAFALSAFMSF